MATREITFGGVGSILDGDTVKAWAAGGNVGILATNKAGTERVTLLPSDPECRQLIDVLQGHLASHKPPSPVVGKAESVMAGEKPE